MCRLRSFGPACSYLVGIYFLSFCFALSVRTTPCIHSPKGSSTHQNVADILRATHYRVVSTVGLEANKFRPHDKDFGDRVALVHVALRGEGAGITYKVPATECRRKGYRPHARLDHAHSGGVVHTSSHLAGDDLHNPPFTWSPHACQPYQRECSETSAGIGRVSLELRAKISFAHRFV